MFRSLPLTIACALSGSKSGRLLLSREMRVETLRPGSQSSRRLDAPLLLCLLHHHFFSSNVVRLRWPAYCKEGGPTPTSVSCNSQAVTTVEALSSVKKMKEKIPFASALTAFQYTDSAKLWHGLGVSRLTRLSQSKRLLKAAAIKWRPQR